MRTLDLKLLRELRRHWVQVTSIALVMGCGTMTIMGLRSTMTSVRAARDSYYDEYRCADVARTAARRDSRRWIRANAHRARCAARRATTLRAGHRTRRVHR